MCKVCRRHSTENNSWSHSHTKRGFPEMVPTMVGPLELMHTYRSGLRVILLGFTHPFQYKTNPSPGNFVILPKTVFLDMTLS